MPIHSKLRQRPQLVALVALQPAMLGHRPIIEDCIGAGCQEQPTVARGSITWRAEHLGLGPRHTGWESVRQCPCSVQYQRGPAHSQSTGCWGSSSGWRHSGCEGPWRTTMQLRTGTGNSGPVPSRADRGDRLDFAEALAGPGASALPTRIGMIISCQARKFALLLQAHHGLDRADLPQPSCVPRLRPLASGLPGGEGLKGLQV